MVSDRIPDRKVANIAASLVAAAASANGSIDEKERELNEVITGLQILREELIRRVSLPCFYQNLPSQFGGGGRSNLFIFRQIFPPSHISCDCRIYECNAI